MSSHKEALIIDGWTALKMCLKQLGCLELDGGHFSADKKKWRAVVKWVMKARVLSTAGNFF